MTRAKLVFEDGKVFIGRAFAGSGERFGEAVFNTAMTGYQEVLTDPSYCGQFVVMTYPHIGNYGVNDEDVESRGLFLGALLIKEYSPIASNWRATQNLKDYLEQHDVMGVEGFDTRAITKYIREKGAMKAILSTHDEPDDILAQKAKESVGMLGQNLAKVVSCDTKYDWEAPATTEYKVAVIDCGVKYNILRLLQKNGCQCTVFPQSVSASEILDGGFDGVFLSNGPGDPEPVTDTIQTIRDLLGKLPIFGICLGHQLLGIALGGQTYKLKFGHHGANHPVRFNNEERVEITSQNHGFCVDVDSLKSDDVELSHINLNDNTVEGIRHKRYPAFSVQYHPEAAPGPHDSEYLFGEFTKMMAGHKS